jgi:hypothetical protein
MTGVGIAFRDSWNYRHRHLCRYGPCVCLRGFRWHEGIRHLQVAPLSC